MRVVGSSEIQSTKEMFIVRALEKILSDRDIRRSHHAQLKRACETELGTPININISTYKITLVSMKWNNKYL